MKQDTKIVKKIIPYALTIGITSITAGLITIITNNTNPTIIIGAISLAIWKAGKHSLNLQDQSQEEQTLKENVSSDIKTNSKKYHHPSHVTPGDDPHKFFYEV